MRRGARDRGSLFGCGLFALFCVLGCNDGRGCKAEPVDVADAATVDESEPSAPIPKLGENQEVLFIGGLMSELYEELSLSLEDELNAALERAARSLNVHIALPGERSIFLPIGDDIAEALPRIEIDVVPGRFISFYTQMRAFEAAGIPCRNASLESPDFDTSQGVSHNARAILKLLRETKKQIILVTHSKGSLDTLEALLSAPELLGTRVIGWVAIQAPFYGSPLANSGTPRIHDMLLRAVGGNGQAIDDLRTQTRAAYMQAHEEQIRALTAGIPVISAYNVYETEGTVTSFASAFADGIFDPALASEIRDVVVENYRVTPSDIPRVLAASTSAAVHLIRERVSNASSAALGTLGLLTLTNVYLDEILDLPNDGLVPRDSTVLPGAIHRELDRGDHASPVMDVDPLKNFWTTEQRNRITVELVQELRARAEQRTP
jgi:hypothetical protein